MAKKRELLVFICFLLVLFSFSFVVSKEDKNFLEKTFFSVKSFFSKITGFVVSDEVKINNQENITEEIVIDPNLTPPLPPDPEENLTDLENAENISSDNEPSKDENNAPPQIPEKIGRFSEEIVSSKVIVGRPVKWVKKIIIEEEGKFFVEVPKNAFNIDVKLGEQADKILNQVKEDLQKVDNESIKKVLVSGKAINVEKKDKIFLSLIKNFFGFTGKAIYDKPLEIEIGSENSKVVFDEPPSKEFVLEYYTPGPEIIEENFDNGKKITIFDQNEVGYKDILAFTDLDNLVVKVNDSNLFLFWLKEGRRVKHDFNSFDVNADGFIDYIEWEVPYLSNQTFELIIMSGGFAGGSGTQGDPYQISTCQQLQNMSSSLSAYYILINDIDCSDTINWNSGQGFEPVGNFYNSFFGSLDGQNYRIINLYIDRPSQDYVGLFGYVGDNGNIRNIGLINSRIRGSSNVGGIAGYFLGSISNSYNTGNISGSSSVGGIAGHFWGSISNSYNTGNVSGSSYVGGIAGSSWGSISNSYNTGNISGSSNVGGIVGLFDGGSISNSYNTGNISGSSNVGGIAGYFWGSISNSFWDIETSGRTNACGSGSCTGAEGKTTSEMKNISTFSNAHWNISLSTYNLNNGYPFLAWQVNNSSFVWLIYSDENNPSEPPPGGSG
ncbi:MAG: GLUG motif-containing protein, partial [Candidatus Pacearchaeota archaeon]